MKKLVVLVALMTASFGAFSQIDRSVEATLKRVEIEKNAICKFEKNSIGLVLNLYRWSKQYYVCDGNEGMFRMAFRVRERGYPGRYGGVTYTDGVVTKIFYFDL